MAHQEDPNTNPVGQWFSQWPMLKLFKTFRSAIQPSRLLVALLGVIVIFLAGTVIDGLWPMDGRVVGYSQSAFNDGLPVNEIEAYLEGQTDLTSYRQKVRAYYERELGRLLSDESPRWTTDDVRRKIEDGKILAEVKESYTAKLSTVSKDLQKRYQLRRQELTDEYSTLLANAPSGQQAGLRMAQDQKRQELETAYTRLTNALLYGGATANQLSYWLDKVVVVSSKLTGDEGFVREVKLQTSQALNLAQAHQLARGAQGQGIFASLYALTCARFHEGINALLFQGKPLALLATFTEIFQSRVWLVRNHGVFAAIFFIIVLMVWAVVGGAVCRMAALQFAREERIGPVRALRFSLKKFGSFFAAPLVPVGVMVLVGVLLALGGFVGAIPYVGEVLAGLIALLAIFGGFVVALVALGLLGGINLMVPAVAVEGSDSFDAISRSFSYVFSRPWRMGVYSLVSLVYGSACYLFVRLFAFLILWSVHFTSGLTMNLDGSSLLESRGKLDAIWPMPSFHELSPPITWATLGSTEQIGAFLFCVWSALVVGMVAAFLVSFFFTANTTIYFLLRHRVDATDMEDVYVEEGMNDLLEEAKPATTEQVSSTGTAEASADQPAPSQPDSGAAGNP